MELLPIFLNEIDADDPRVVWSLIFAKYSVSRVFSEAFYHAHGPLGNGH